MMLALYLVLLIITILLNLFSDSFVQTIRFGCLFVGLHII